MRPRTHDRFLTLTILALVLALPGLAAAQYASISGIPGDQAGYEMGPAPDLDGDGVNDLFVVSYINAKLTLYSGATQAQLGQPLTGLPQPAGISYFHSATFIDDISGDGVPDLLIGSPGAPLSGVNYVGRFDVYSGSTLTTMPLLLLTVPGSTACPLGCPGPATLVGWKVARAGDVDGDGVGDFIVTNGWVRARVYSGAIPGPLPGSTPVMLRDHAPNSASDGYGYDACGMGDLDGDGCDDYAVGAPGFNTSGTATGSGYVNLHSGMTGALLVTVNGSVSGEAFGQQVANAGDLDGDGINELLVGSPRDAGRQGKVTVFSGASLATGSPVVMATLSGPASGSRFAESVESVGDTNGDGVADFAVGATYFPGGVGEVYLYSGASRLPLQVVTGTQPGGEFGAKVAGLGNLTGTGLAEWAASEPQADGSGPASGIVWIYSGSCTVPYLSFTSPLPGSQGTFTMNLLCGPPSGTYLVIYSTTNQGPATWFGLNVSLGSVLTQIALGSPLVTGTLNAAGTATVSIPNFSRPPWLPTLCAVGLVGPAFPASITPTAVTCF